MTQKERHIYDIVMSFAMIWIVALLFTAILYATFLVWWPFALALPVLATLSIGAYFDLRRDSTPPAEEKER